MTTEGYDIHHMKAALALSRRGLGAVWPNPAVGCVVVKDGCVVGRGWTQPGGRPHAEAEALRRAGDRAQGADVFVTLEPCSHHGQTPPCAQALIDAGVRRVVVASNDPDARVSGRGLAMLRTADIEVQEGFCRNEADAVHAGFFMRIREGRPLVTLKTATTLDGRIATASGESQWITGPEARLAGHLIRAKHDAIMVGIGTVLSDDPSLTCRLPGYRAAPLVRIVMDSSLRMPLDSNLVLSAKETPVWVVCLAGLNPGKQALLRDAGVEILECQEDGEGRVDVMAALRQIGDAGITRLMVEGGGQLAASLLQADRVDEIAWFRAAAVIGGDGYPAVASYGLDHLVDMRRFVLGEARKVGGDLAEYYRRAAPVAKTLKETDR